MPLYGKGSSQMQRTACPVTAVCPSSVATIRYGGMTKAIIIVSQAIPHANFHPHDNCLIIVM